MSLIFLDEISDDLETSNSVAQEDEFGSVSDCSSDCFQIALLSLFWILHNLTSDIRSLAQDRGRARSSSLSLSPSLPHLVYYISFGCHTL